MRALCRFARRIPAAALPFLLIAGCAPATLPLGPAPKDALDQLDLDKFVSHVRFLADPRLGGRMTGTAGNDEAAEYIAKRFMQIGLKPGGPDGGWFQDFAAPNCRVPAPGTSLRFTHGGKGVVARLHEGFAPMAAGTNGVFRAPLVFGGYGVRNRSRGYNDYASVSARGAVVMLLQGEPHDENGRSRWARAGKWTRLASTGYKLAEAARQGAVAALLVTPPDIAPKHDPLYQVLGEAKGPIPAARISRALADKLLAPCGRTVADLVRQIHSGGKPASVAVGGLIEGKILLEVGRGRNVIGLLAATSGAAAVGPVVIIGAHYDHIPASGARAVDEGFGVRPGADDNASGVGVMLMVAAAAARLGERACTYVFIAFSGEEIGRFFGSKHYVAHPTVDLDRLALMVNLDQVGRLRNDRLLVLGSTLSRRVRGPLAGASRSVPTLKTTMLPVTSKKRWSDQAPFANAGLRTLFFHARMPPERHTMRDTADLLNNEGAVRIARFVFEFIRYLDAAYSRP